MPNWPRDMLATLQFEELSSEKTRINFYWEPRNATPEEIEVFEPSRADHSKGWGAGMEQLQSYLASL